MSTFLIHAYFLRSRHFTKSRLFSREISTVLAFIGIAIFEYALILGVKKDKNHSEVDAEEKIGRTNKNRSDAMFNRLDKIMIVILPSTFLAFTAIFWKVHSTVAVDY